MRRDRQNGDLPLLGAVAPEHPIGAGGAVLDIGLKHLFSWVERIQQGGKGMGVQAWMAGAVGRELADAALNLLKEAELFGLAVLADRGRGRLLQLLELIRGLRGPADLETHSRVSSSAGKAMARAWAAPRSGPFIRFPAAACSRPRRTELRASVLRNSQASEGGRWTVSTGSRMSWLPCSTSRKLRPALDLPRLIRPP